MLKVRVCGRACQAPGQEAHQERVGCLELWAAGQLRTASEGYALVALPLGMRITMANPFEDPDASYRILRPKSLIEAQDG